MNYHIFLIKICLIEVKEYNLLFSDKRFNSLPAFKRKQILFEEKIKSKAKLKILIFIFSNIQKTTNT
jgi:hypothetical protein